MTAQKFSEYIESKNGMCHHFYWLYKWGDRLTGWPTQWRHALCFAQSHQNIFIAQTWGYLFREDFVCRGRKLLAWVHVLWLIPWRLVWRWMFDRDRGFPTVDTERTRADRGPTQRASSLPGQNAKKYWPCTYYETMNSTKFSQPLFVKRSRCRSRMPSLR